MILFYIHSKLCTWDVKSHEEEEAEVSTVYSLLFEKGLQSYANKFDGVPERVSQSVYRVQNGMKNAYIGAS